jgi:hypothetical protein
MPFCGTNTIGRSLFTIEGGSTQFTPAISASFFTLRNSILDILGLNHLPFTNVGAASWWILLKSRGMWFVCGVGVWCNSARRFLVYQIVEQKFETFRKFKQFVFLGLVCEQPAQDGRNKQNELGSQAGCTTGQPNSKDGEK